jgi:glycosyltransferase involved in cell wall biosynthesis
MRILYHHRTLGDGAEGIHIRAIVDAWRESGHDVLVSALVGAENDPSEPTESAARWARVKRRIPRALYEWAEIGYNAVGLARLLRAGHGFRPDFIYDRYVTFDAAAVVAARVLGCPVVVEANAPLAFERARYETLRYPRLARWFERRILSGADLAVVVSTPLKSHFERIGVPAAKIRVLPNGADPRRFRPEIDGAETRRRHGLADSVVVGFSGSLRDWHGVDLLLEAVARAAARAPALRVLVVGDGPLRGELEREARDPRLAGRVAFAGRVSHELMPEHLAAMDIPVSPRATFYASPMKVLEYMATGRAPVAPRMANLEDIVEDGADGLLFVPESVDDLAGAIARLALDADLRRALGRAARAKVVRERNWAACAARVLAWVGELPHGRPRPELAHAGEPRPGLT